ncbi:MAG: hypothetical protein C0597_01610 [Marinilabiliales bacterium]|nr:MAG: hypothetical protein C0597_01610 [Marinilabiliales bacterium]
MIDIKQHNLYKAMEVDGVLSNIFNIYFKNFLTLFLYSFVAVFAIQMVLYQLGFMELYKVGFDKPEEFLAIYSKLMSKIAIISVLSVIVYGLLNSFLVRYLLQTDTPHKSSVGEIFIDSIRKYSVHMIFFLILSTLILIVGAIIGVLALFIGAFIAMIYLGTALIVGGSILVAEEKNAIETIGRSFTLVHKDFWPTLGALILFILIMILASIVLAAVMAIPYVIMFVENWHETGSFRDIFNVQMYDLGIWSVVINSIVSAITYPMYAIVSVVLYIRLRFIEDQRNLKQ